MGEFALERVLALVEGGHWKLPVRAFGGHPEAGLAYPAIATKSTLVGPAPALQFARIVLCETIE
jgi:hypothetical protein